MRILIETRWFTIDIHTPQPDPPTSPTVQASGQTRKERTNDQRD